MANLQNVDDISIKMSEIKIEQKNSPLAKIEITNNNNFTHKIQFTSITDENGFKLHLIKVLCLTIQ